MIIKETQEGKKSTTKKILCGGEPKKTLADRKEKSGSNETGEKR